MTSMKTRLLTATIIAGGLAGIAQAQVALPAATLRGAGATAPAPVLVTNLNCIGQPGAPSGNPAATFNQYGTNSGSLTFITAGNYAPTTPGPTNPVLNCASQEIQPAFEGKYIGTGSGTGRAFWRAFANQLTSTTNLNPFGETWSNVQFAFSDAPVSTGDLSTYASTANNSTNAAGPAIQVPFFVFPVALAYNARYGIKNTGGGPLDLTFNLKYPITVTLGGVPTVIGGLRLSREAYCKIFNGEITNFNDPVIRALNAKSNTTTSPLYTIIDSNGDDSQSRWNSEGVPIRLVGRIDNSGTTDNFTRHLAAVCNGLGFTNKYLTAAEALPYDRTSTGQPIMSTFRTDTAYTNTGSNSTRPVAGTAQTISGVFWNKNTDTLQTATFGAEAPGKFIVADGSDGVEEAVRVEGATLVTSTIDNSIQLNGKLGYISSDWVAGATGRILHSAQLPEGNSGTVYKMPRPADASKAVGSLLPPQTIATSGAYNVTDARPGSGDNGFTTLNRANPRDWLFALYPTSGATLADPAKGYPITGVSSLLTYTCFSTQAKQLAMGQAIGVMLGKVTKKADATSLSPNTFKGTGATSLGIDTQLNLTIVPAAWQTAITETFLKKSTQSSGGGTLGDRNLWIQSYAPAKAADFDGTNLGSNKEVLANPACTAGKGA